MTKKRTLFLISWPAVSSEPRKCWVTFTRTWYPERKKPRDVSAVSSIEVPGWRKFLKRAVEARNSYESHLSAIMQRHGISTEAELFTVVISRHSRFNSLKLDEENAELVIAKQCEHLLKSTRKRSEDDVKHSITRYEPDDDEE